MNDDTAEALRELVLLARDQAAHLLVLESFLVATVREMARERPEAAVAVLAIARQYNARDDKLFEAINGHWDRLVNSLGAPP